MIDVISILILSQLFLLCTDIVIEALCFWIVLYKNERKLKKEKERKHHTMHACTYVFPVYNVLDRISLSLCCDKRMEGKHQTEIYTELLRKSAEQCTSIGLC